MLSIGTIKDSYSYSLMAEGAVHSLTSELWSLLNLSGHFISAITTIMMGTSEQYKMKTQQLTYSLHNMSRFDI